MLAAILQAADSLAVSIPSFSNRFNFALPLIVVLVIVMFFLLLKVYTLEHPESEQRANPRKRGKIT